MRLAPQKKSSIVTTSVKDQQCPGISQIERDSAQRSCAFTGGMQEMYRLLLDRTDQQVIRVAIIHNIKAV